MTGLRLVSRALECFLVITFQTITNFNKYPLYHFHGVNRMNEAVIYGCFRNQLTSVFCPYKFNSVEYLLDLFYVGVSGMDKTLQLIMMYGH